MSIEQRRANASESKIERTTLRVSRKMEKDVILIYAGLIDVLHYYLACQGRLYKLHACTGVSAICCHAQPLYALQSHYTPKETPKNRMVRVSRYQSDVSASHGLHD